ncbi:putative flavin carrier protein 3 [Podospora pseudopauciseta]|uniref:Flavin carrier protein 3 n=2 Tax=Podospora TaxID=5144 RepID=A0ABR0HBJ0_9PEZI|nr:putative flavin carrier protein 3 [Podospora pseudopauciseta]KAK4676394.1 putative flavin carrier protein 3 [Podospora pseudoanserina]
MRLPSLNPLFAISTLATLLLPVVVTAESVLRSSSLAACQASSGFTASLFDVVFTPNNRTVAIDLLATSSIEGYVLFDITIIAYGYKAIQTTVDPCEAKIMGLCPMVSGKMTHPFNLGPFDKEALDVIPGIAYTFPDLDATVRVYINMTSGENKGQTIACLEADVSNGKTVDLIGVKWAAAAVILVAFIASAIVAGLGFTNAASHIAANTLALLAYFQSQAMIGLCSVSLPPVVQSWTQDFQWTMGIIRVGFIQTILTWYQRSTGGTASVIFDTLSIVSVQVEKMKRSLPVLEPAVQAIQKRATDIAHHASTLGKRSYEKTEWGSYIVYGIQRVAFRARIETTNLFLTGITFFYILCLVLVILVLLFKVGVELAVRLKISKGDRFSEFRTGWLTTLKGILFRLTLVCFPPVVILCLWEFTQVDSPGAVVLAVFFLFSMLGALSYAAFKIIQIARRSVALHRNPAYILFSEPRVLNKWGFLYVQYRASAYYFIVPTLVYILVKGMFIALAQRSGVVQAVALIIIEAAALITVSVIRPFMDKSTNSFNIAICSLNFVNAIFLFVFTDVFGLPGLVIGVVGVVLWIANAAFSLILLLMLIITTGIILFHNNPDTRYQFMNDDRTSFIKSQTHIATTSELDALAATARGTGKTIDLDDDESARSSPANVGGLPRPGTAGSNTSPNRYSLKSVRDSARNSVRSSMIAPGGVYMSEKPGGQGHHLRNQASGSVRAPSPLTASGSDGSLPKTSSPPKPQGGNQWQRGAGYD